VEPLHSRIWFSVGKETFREAHWRSRRKKRTLAEGITERMTTDEEENDLAKNIHSRGIIGLKTIIIWGEKQPERKGFFSGRLLWTSAEGDCLKFSYFS